MYTISKTFAFSASHELRELPDGHQCKRNHGHNYAVTLHLASGVLGDHMVVDYGELAAFKTYLEQTVEHQLLNDVLALAMPTAEELAFHFFQVARSLWPEMVAVSVKETDATEATYSDPFWLGAGI